jgi:hypothetical protein
MNFIAGSHAQEVADLDLVEGDFLLGAVLADAASSLRG